MARPACRKGDSHIGSTDIQGSPNHYTNGRPSHRKGDADTLGTQLTASTKTFINGRGRARRLDFNNIFSPELTGSPNVFVD
jgi:hypothetical protein